MMIKYWLVIMLSLLNASLCLAENNPVDVVLTPLTGLPPITHIGNDYTVQYTFTNNLNLSVLINVTEGKLHSDFVSDGLCANIVLSPKGQPGSTCTTYIDYTPTKPGRASFGLSLQYHHNVVPIRPFLTTQVKSLCGTVVYPSNTGIPVPNPIIDSDNVWSFVSAPQLHPVKFQFQINAPDQLASGFIFNGSYANSGSSTYGQSGALITDNSANPVWFRPLSSTSLMNTDVKVQTYHHQPVLTFWQGTLATPPSYTNIPGGGAEPGSCFYILDNSYRLINTVTAYHDFIPDVHEFLITPRNTLLFLATKVIPMDLTPYGGPQNGAIHDFSIQEVDIATNQLIFFWDAIDHIKLSTSFMPIASATESSNVWDPYHLNSIGLIDDSPDDLLISGRNTWTIYRLNKATGNFVWTLVGDGSGEKIKIIDSRAKFSWQHDARFLNGKVSLFDDECCANPEDIPPSTKPSHGLVLNLDLINHVATFDTSYYYNPPVISSSQGNNQLLTNDNRFVGFGSSGSFAEYAMAGNTEANPALNFLYSGQMPGRNVSYRSYRQTWVGRPYYPPSIAVNTNANQTIVYASWNGATEVQSWQVYAGFYSDRLALVGSATKSGFETAITVSGGSTFYQVKALNAQGEIIGSSKIIYQP